MVAFNNPSSDDKKKLRNVVEQMVKNLNEFAKDINPGVEQEGESEFDCFKRNIKKDLKQMCPKCPPPDVLSSMIRVYFMGWNSSIACRTLKYLELSYRGLELMDKITICLNPDWVPDDSWRW